MGSIKTCLGLLVFSVVRLLLVGMQALPCVNFLSLMIGLITMINILPSSRTIIYTHLHPPPPHMHTHSCTHTFSLTHAYSHPHTHAHAHTFSLSHIRMLTHTHTHILSLTHTYSHAHSHTNGQLHTQIHDTIYNPNLQSYQKVAYGREKQQHKTGRGGGEGGHGQSVYCFRKRNNTPLLSTNESKCGSFGSNSCEGK